MDQSSMSRRRERHFGDRVVWCFHERGGPAVQTLAGLCAAAPDALALVFEDQRWTRGALFEQVQRCASGLRAQGVREGTRVVMLMGNRPEFVFVFYALQWLAAIAVPMDPRQSAREIVHVVNDAGAALLLHDVDLADRLPEPGDFSAPLQFLPMPEGDAALAFGESANREPPVPVVSQEEDVTAILYTSGSTGKPKGAALTHLNIAHSVIHHSGNLGLDENDRIAMPVPLSKVTGLVCGVVAALLGGSLLILMRRFRAADFIALAERHRMTYTVLVPAMYNLCLREPSFASADLCAWRIGHFGGAPMPTATIAALRERLPRLRLFNGYGSTETSSPAVMTPPGEALRGDSVGKPLACVELIVVDPDTGKEVPPGTRGEIWMRSPGVVRAYWNQPEATAAGIVEGFWRSGDVGSVDAEGWVYVHDRLKDMVNRGGYKIYTAEVEDVLATCPGVVEAAIVGRPDAVLGERVHAEICIEAGVDPDAVRRFCAERLADYQVPESYSFRTEPLPRNATGKIDKLQLRAMAAALPAFVVRPKRTSA